MRSNAAEIFEELSRGTGGGLPPPVMSYAASGSLWNLASGSGAGKASIAYELEKQLFLKF